MTNILQLHSAKRSLAHVLLDIAETDRRWRHSWGDTDMELQLLDRLDALRDEARRMVEFSCGVAWGQLSEAGL